MLSLLRNWPDILDVLHILAESIKEHLKTVTEIEEPTWKNWSKAM